jgi:single-strand DNA-binding protein
MVNRVILVGNLTRDAESIAARSPMTRLRIATNAVWRDAEGNRQESAEFHTVISFGRLAEICAAYCVKGRRVYVEGKLRTREYDSSDGLRKVTTEIVADIMQLLDRRDGAAERDPDGETEPNGVAPALATAG